MSDTPIGQREYGQLEAHVAQLREDVRDLQLTVNKMAEMMQQARGGWRAIALMSGIAGAIGAAATWAAQHVRFGP